MIGNNEGTMKDSNSSKQNKNTQKKEQESFPRIF